MTINQSLKRFRYPAGRTRIRRHHDAFQQSALRFSFSRCFERRCKEQKAVERRLADATKAAKPKEIETFSASPILVLGVR